jgi:hypothetical protein
MSTTSLIRNFIAQGQWREATACASKLAHLGDQRDAILSAQGAYTNPGFYQQIGKDPAALVRAGKAALQERFKQETDTVATTKTYSTASSARRAALAAGHSEFDVRQTTDGRYRIKASPAKGKPKAGKSKSVRKTEAPAIRTPGGKRAVVLEAAKAGKLPDPPDFSANTHRAFRGRLAAMLTAIAENDIAALKAVKINPCSTSPKALERYRELVLIALAAQKKKAA